MKDSEKIRKLDDMIFNLAIDYERAAVMADEIGQSYFDLNDDYSKLCYFGKTGVEFAILSDYVIRIGDQLTEVKKMIREWRGSCEEKGGATE